MRNDLTPIAQILQRFLAELAAGPPKVSFQKIGDRVGISGAHINNYANGRTSNPGHPQQRAILTGLAAEVDAYLLRHPEDRSDVDDARRTLKIDGPPLPPSTLIRIPKAPPDPRRRPGRPPRARGRREAARHRRRPAASGE